jgi:glycosyltransferase involved in cell wall biosynthesis
MIQIIKQTYNQTTLQLFVNKSRIDKITLDQINKLDYVFLNDRVSQEQLGIEFLKTDIWLYPTHFPETYCITAVEAMAAKCLIVTTKTAALTDLVNGRGILCEGPLDTDKNFDKMLEKLYFILERPQLKEHMINKAFDFAKTQSFTNLVNKWLNLMYN